MFDLLPEWGLMLAVNSPQDNYGINCIMQHPEDVR